MWLNFVPSLLITSLPRRAFFIEKRKNIVGSSA